MISKTNEKSIFSDWLARECVRKFKTLVFLTNFSFCRNIQEIEDELNNVSTSSLKRGIKIFLTKQGQLVEHGMAKEEEKLTATKKFVRTMLAIEEGKWRALFVLMQRYLRNSDSQQKVATALKSARRELAEWVRTSPDNVQQRKRAIISMFSRKAVSFMNFYGRSFSKQGRATYQDKEIQELLNDFINAEGDEKSSVHNRMIKYSAQFPGRFLSSYKDFLRTKAYSDRRGISAEDVEAYATWDYIDESTVISEETGLPFYPTPSLTTGLLKEEKPYQTLQGSMIQSICFWEQWERGLKIIREISRTKPVPGMRLLRYAKGKQLVGGDKGKSP